MNKAILGLSTLVLVAGSTASAAEKRFEIDPVHSGVTFRIRHLYSTFNGRFNKFAGTITGDLEKPTTLKVVAEVNVASVDTANEGRDRHLRAADFFLTKKHPVARFESLRAVPGKDNNGTVVGKLTLRGITREVTFTGKFLGYGPDHRGGHRAGFHATATINKSDFGIGFNAKLPNGVTILGEEVELVLDIEAIEVKEVAAAAPKTMAERVKELKAKGSKKGPLPEAVKRALAKAREKIEAQGGTEGLRIGTRAPDFTLPDAGGKSVTLSKRLKKGPVVLVFYRGEWCPFCNIQLKALEEAYPRIKELGASIVGVAPQMERKALLQQKKNDLSFSLLSDHTGDVLRSYRLLYHIPDEMRKVYLEQYGIDLEEYNGEGRWELPVTATYVVDTAGLIRAGLVDMDYTKRMEPADIITELEKMAK